MIVYTALHGMQTRSSDEPSVCPTVRLSVCLSNSRIVTKFQVEGVVAPTNHYSSG